MRKIDIVVAGKISEVDAVKSKLNRRGYKVEIVYEGLSVETIVSRLISVSIGVVTIGTIDTFFLFQQERIVKTLFELKNIRNKKNIMILNFDPNIDHLCDLIEANMK